MPFSQLQRLIAIVCVWLLRAAEQDPVRRIPLRSPLPFKLRLPLRNRSQL